MNWNKIVRNVYYLFKRLSKGIKLLFNELFKPISFLKGEDFERCLRKKVFPPEHYDLVSKTHDFHENNSDYVESSLYPDYLFRNKETNEEFWVEAKYRERTFRGKIEWCKPFQLKRYKKLGKNTTVIIAIGYSGRPRNPEKIYLVPLEQVKYTGLYPKALANFEFNGNQKNIFDGLLDKVYDYEKK